MRGLRERVDGGLGFGLKPLAKTTLQDVGVHSRRRPLLPVIGIDLHHLLGSLSAKRVGGFVVDVKKSVGVCKSRKIGARNVVVQLWAAHSDPCGLTLEVTGAREARAQRA